MSSRAGTPAQPSDLIDVRELVDAYFHRVPDLSDPAQRVVFGTSGHRGSSLDGAFTETHIAPTGCPAPRRPPRWRCWRRTA